jgi:hypothetical protein
MKESGTGFYCEHGVSESGGAGGNEAAKQYSMPYKCMNCYYEEFKSFPYGEEASFLQVCSRCGCKNSRKNLLGNKTPFGPHFFGAGGGGMGTAVGGPGPVPKGPFGNIKCNSN